MTIVQGAKGFGFKVRERERLAHLINKIFLGDPVPKLLGVGEMRPPGDIPDKRFGARGHAIGRPINGLVPYRRRAPPRFGIIATHVGSRPENRIATRMRQEAHEVVAGIGV